MILLQLLFCALLVFGVTAIVLPVVLGIDVAILAPAEKALDDAAEKIAPTPDRYKKQQEV